MDSALTRNTSAHTHTHMRVHAHIQTDMLTYRQTGRHTDRQVDRHTHTPFYSSSIPDHHLQHNFFQHMQINIQTTYNQD